MKITIPIKCPSWNEYLRMHYQPRGKLNDQIYELVWADCVDHFRGIIKGLSYFNSPVKIIFTANYKGKRRHDTDNCCAKPFIDGLVKANIISDDNCEVVKELITHCQINQKEDSVVIEINLNI